MRNRNILKFTHILHTQNTHSAALADAPVEFRESLLEYLREAIGGEIDGRAGLIKGLGVGPHLAHVGRKQVGVVVVFAALELALRAPKKQLGGR